MVVNLERSKTIWEISIVLHLGGLILMEFTGVGRTKVKAGSTVVWTWPLDLTRSQLTEQKRSLSSSSCSNTVLPAASSSQCLRFPTKMAGPLCCGAKWLHPFCCGPGILSAMGTVAKFLVVTIKISAEVSQNIKYRTSTWPRYTTA